MAADAAGWLQVALVLDKLSVVSGSYLGNPNRRTSRHIA